MSLCLHGLADAAWMVYGLPSAMDAAPWRDFGHDPSRCGIQE